jgi:LacI family repressor for deo operon, udp, cdd, tsx, nupC, and nupG
LQLRKPPTALFFCNDEMALGGLTRLREQGIVVPHDMAVAGFDDIPFAKYASPPLTTIAQPAFQIGGAAMRAMIDILARKQRPADILLAHELVVRVSSRSTLG